MWSKIFLVCLLLSVSLVEPRELKSFRKASRYPDQRYCGAAAIRSLESMCGKCIKNLENVMNIETGEKTTFKEQCCDKPCALGLLAQFCCYPPFLA